MINTKKLLEMAKKWQKMAAMGRKRISLTRPYGSIGTEARGKSATDKGCFVVYTTDGMRFAFPLVCLNNSIIIELLKMSEEEYGLPCNGPITLPCDAAFMQRVVSMVGQRRVSKDEEKSLLVSIATGRCFASSIAHRRMTNQQILLPSF